MKKKIIEITSIQELQWVLVECMSGGGLLHFNVQGQNHFKPKEKKDNEKRITN